MTRAAQRVMVPLMLLAVVGMTSGCGPEAYEGFSQIINQFVGGVLAIGILILVIAGAIPPT
jgi:hypothetical protein